ncbi:hypothetical protein TRFO_40806 [Tritrichomonas foetus]|uniref:HTH CENPB-type domain-containing protein n=1 Tax=Tritrichomonas foetus TaxID=1144522 RepID=A0A1J4IZX7_9EUKA|nr:hypothetical protein TRFO_40806 [Tritrichomonas foetus]|eukprot:OHS92896.1 hypothetical protein TRFO_40806 [Tritrichomonas foetus]
MNNSRCLTKQQWIRIKLEFEHLKTIKIHERTGIPIYTLKNWKHNFMLKPNFIPFNETSGKRRLFKPEEEEAIADYIRTNYIKSGMLFTNSDFQSLVTELYLFFNADNENIRQFYCSPVFISDFKKRHRFMSKRFHYKRKPNVTEEQQRMWMEKITELLTTKPNDRIINSDVTAWFVYPNRLLSWINTGKDNNR